MIETIDLAKFKNRTEKSIRHLAFVEAKKDHGQELMNILFNTIVEPTRREEGNIAFVPHFSVDNPDEILFDEIWINKESINNHFKQSYMKDLFPKIEHLLAKPVVLKAYREVKVSDI
jgi:quinol monooxygenase YgiN